MLSPIMPRLTRKVLVNIRTNPMTSGTTAGDKDMTRTRDNINMTMTRERNRRKKERNRMTM